MESPGLHTPHLMSEAFAFLDAWKADRARTTFVGADAKAAE